MSQAESVQLKLTFLPTYHGLAKIVQILSGFIANICLGWSFNYGDGFFVINLIALVLIFTLLINIFQFLFHLLNLNNVWNTINWRRTELVYAIVGLILTFICMAFETYYAFRWTFVVRWLFTAIFGWILCGAFGVETFLFLTGRIEQSPMRSNA